LIFRFIVFIIKEIGFKLDPFKIKKIVDTIFVFAEKNLVKLPGILPLYFSFYEDMINREIDLAKITKKDKILHVGSGCIPATAILISRKTGAKVVSIDNNLKSIKNAQILISKLKMDELIKIKNGESTSYPLGDFNIIIISQGINPYKQTIKYLEKNMKKDSKIILRSSTLNDDLSDRDKILKKYFIIENIKFHKSNGPLISILLSKK